MKKLFVVALVAIAVLVICAPAMAWPVAQKWWEPSSHFTAVGKIQAVDTTASTVTVRVHLASRGAADYLGDDLTIAVAADAHVYKAVGARFESITLGDLVVGEKLRVEGQIGYSTGSPVFTGHRLVMRRLPINEIRRFAFRGQVTAVDATAGTLTATMDRVTRALSPYYHGSCDFVVAAGARIWVMKNGWPAKATLADVVVGDRVYAQGGADREHPVEAGVHHPLDDRAPRSGGDRRALTAHGDRSDGPGGASAPPGPSHCSDFACSSAAVKSSFSTSSTFAMRRFAPGNTCSMRSFIVTSLTMASAASPLLSASASSSASFLGRPSSMWRTSAPAPAPRIASGTRASGKTTPTIAPTPAPTQTVWPECLRRSMRGVPSSPLVRTAAS